MNIYVFLVDFENVIRCISIKDGNELWNFSTEKSYIKSQRKLSLIIQNGLVIFIDTFCLNFPWMQIIGQEISKDSRQI